MGYTWAQMTAYLQLARQERARRRRDHLVDASNAFAGGDGAKQLFKALSQQAED